MTDKASTSDSNSAPLPARRGVPGRTAATPAGPGTTEARGTVPGFAKGFGMTFATMFKHVYTEQYPYEVFPTAPRYHGRHVLNRHPDGLEKCVGCELCAWACPADAIYVEGGDNTEEARFSPGERYGRVYQINYLRCIFCGLCIEACPTRSLTMSNEYELALDNRQDLIYTKEQLMAPLLPGMEAPPHAMRLGDSDTAYYVQTPQRGGVPASQTTVPAGAGSAMQEQANAGASSVAAPAVQPEGHRV